jgi:PAS domain S-box-containing protein
VKSDESRTKSELIAELDRLRHELAVGESEDHCYRELIEIARTIAVEFDERGSITLTTPSVVPVLGYHPEEIAGLSGLELIHEGDHEAVRALIANLRTTGRGELNAGRVRHKDGRWVWVKVVASKYQGPDRVGYFALLEDVSDLRATVSALRASENRYRTLAENASDLILEVDAEGRFQFLSPNCSSLLSLPLETALGKTMEDSGIAENLHADDRRALFATFRRGLESGQATRSRFRFRYPDGNWHWLESVSNPFAHSDGSWSVVAVCRDITETEHIHQQLRESEERYRIVTEIGRDGVIEVNDAGEIIFASPSMEWLWGYTTADLIGKNYVEHSVEVVHPDELDISLAEYRSLQDRDETVHYSTCRVRCKDGSWKWIRSVGSYYESASGERRYLEVSRDVDDEIRAEETRRALEQKMQQAQRLESLGVMAGGITHDFNNLLTPILGDASLALLDLPLDSPVRIRIQKIQKAAHRAAALTNQMLAYSGQGPVLIEPIDLSQLVDEMRQLLEGAVSGRAVLVSDLADDLPAVEGDATQLSQVVMNLITNASEAVQEGAGRIVLRTGTVEAEKIDRPSLYGIEKLKPGTYVFVEVIDDGSGMDDETRARIFDPFFTTKFTGRGLGLAAALGIVRSHEGAIELDSAVGRGTRFRVLIPSAGRSVIHRAPQTSLPANWRGRGTVLVVDDDEGVRDMVGETLRRVGLTVLLAGGGLEGLEIFRRHADEIRAVVLDRTMPDIGSDEVFDEIRRIRPGARVILISGRSEERATWHFLDKGLDAFLHKPFEPTMLLDRIRRILDDT